MQVLRVSFKPWQFIASLLTVLAAPAFFVAEDIVSGLVLLALGLTAGWWTDRGACLGQCSVPLPRGVARGDRPPSMLRDLSLIAVGLIIIRLISLEAQLDNVSMLKFTLALGGAVAVPYLISRFVYGDRAIGFPWRGGRRWGVWHWGWIAAVIVLGWLILPYYFITSGVYANWPEVTEAGLIARLFIGVGAVGIWDELFFICTVFVLLLRHLPPWAANVLQAVVFVSFLWELGYREWGPLLTIPFALMQGFIFLRSRSLGFVVFTHLLFDAVVFAVLVAAYNPEWLAWFPQLP